jgi:quinol-cytochrome oxidoreductase complex cytochrome b subunit
MVASPSNPSSAAVVSVSLSSESHLALTHPAEQTFGGFVLLTVIATVLSRITRWHTRKRLRSQPYAPWQRHLAALLMFIAAGLSLVGLIALLEGEVGASIPMAYAIFLTLWLRRLQKRASA